MSTAITSSMTFSFEYAGLSSIDAEAGIPSSHFYYIPAVRCRATQAVDTLGKALVELEPLHAPAPHRVARRRLPTSPCSWRARASRPGTRRLDNAYRCQRPRGQATLQIGIISILQTAAGSCRGSHVCTLWGGRCMKQPTTHSMEYY